MIKKRILFVDDEPNVLDGLRNLLRKQRQQWDMLFASSGAAALEEMAKVPVDVIVSDMRMPGMDGAQLLTRVKELYPQTARIVLSGHAEREAISRVLSVAHQFMGKPSDADAVRIVVERTCQFQALMHDPSLRSIVGSLKMLPSLPEIYWELTRAVEDPKVGIGDVAKIVERDPAMSLKVLQLVNSAYYGVVRQIESISKAVSYLGLENLKALIVTAHIFGTDENVSASDFSLTRLREEAVVTANLAKQIVKDPKNAESAFAISIVHDVGQLVLSRDPTKKYGEVIRVAAESGQLLRLVEKETIGTTHGIVGAYLLGVWGLPFAMAETVAFHDCPSAMIEGNTDILGAVHVADALVNSAMSNQEALAAGNLDVPFLERLGLMGEVPKWFAKAQAAVSAMPGRG